jgi:uncharacterized protein YecT (DUF1311 family)
MNQMLPRMHFSTCQTGWPVMAGWVPAAAAVAAAGIKTQTAWLLHRAATVAQYSSSSHCTSLPQT